jgi:hypothetical protein
VLAGIFWIGQTYYFTKLEGRMALDEEEARKAGRLPQVWLVHSGSFSVVEKQASPKAVPSKFYWFRWEALVTWISGFLLLGLLYYSGGLLLDDSISAWGRESRSAWVLCFWDLRCMRGFGGRLSGACQCWREPFVISWLSRWPTG